MGATIRRVSESFLHKSDENPQGIPGRRKVMAAALGVVEDVPFVNETARIRQDFARPRPARPGNRRSRPISSDPAGRLSGRPILLDKDSEGNPIPAQPPTGVMDNIESGIPGLRQNVPVNEKKQRQLADR